MGVIKYKNGLYRSSLGPKLQAFIEAKHNANSPYSSDYFTLHQFDLFVAEFFPNATTISKEMIEKWLEINSKFHINGQRRKFTPINQFCIFLNKQGIDCYQINSPFCGKGLKYQPHIFTDKEKVALFKSIDEYSEKLINSPIKQLIFPTIFRLIYCCGLRNSEARNLKCEDVNLEAGKLIIRGSKAHKERIVMLHSDIQQLLIEYEKRVDILRSNRGYFFPNELIFDRPISSNSITNAFHRSWDHLVEAKQANAPKARIHDLRHAAALDIIRNWVSVGKNLNALYPYLSSYLGHVSYTETDYYVHLSTDFYSDIESKMQSVNDYLYGDDDDE